RQVCGAASGASSEMSPAHRGLPGAEPEGAVQEVAIDRSGEGPSVGGHRREHGPSSASGCAKRSPRVYSGRGRGQSEVMNATPTPAVVPILVYEDIEAAHDFLVGTFGLASGGLHRLDDGTVVHGEVRNGGAPIWLHQVAADAGMASPHQASMSHGGLSVRIPEVDAHYDRVKAAGARIESEPTDQPYGLREYGVRDLENHRWWF